MTPLLPTPDHYIYNLITMTSPEAKRMWRQSHQGTLQLSMRLLWRNLMNYMNLLWITLCLALLGDKRLQETWFHPAGNVIKKRGQITGSRG
jgi:hypothetical protein